MAEGFRRDFNHFGRLNRMSVAFICFALAIEALRSHESSHEREHALFGRVSRGLPPAPAQREWATGYPRGKHSKACQPAALG